jgi:xylan 1,4-beta-xylosidase
MARYRTEELVAPVSLLTMNMLSFRTIGMAFLLFASAGPPPSAPAAEPVVIIVYASETSRTYRPVWNYFGADEPNYVYARNGEKLLHELAALSPVPVYFRAHNLLTTGTGEGSLKWGSTNVYTELPGGTPVYDWTITDRIFDALSRNGVRPLVEVGFMPEALSTHPRPYRHDFPRGDIFTGWSYPPRDYDKWQALITSWVQHLHERYGEGVKDWLWEVWNEPDIPYWHGTPEEYNRLYDVTAAAIRHVLPSARIGGPETTRPSSAGAGAFLSQFLEHCARGRNAATGGIGAPLDFISFHPKGSPKSVDGHVRMGLAAQLFAVDRGMQIVASFPEWRSTPIILGESDPEGCAACQGVQNGYRNGPLYGVTIAEATARTYELERTYGVNLMGIVTWAFEFEDQPYFAGFRELATNGVDKPVLNVFRMLGMLGGDWVNVQSNGALPLSKILREGVVDAPDIDAMATRRPRELDILVWNYHDDDVAAEPVTIRLQIDALPELKTRVEEFRMDLIHSNAYAAWQKIGRPNHPTTAEQVQLEKSGMLEAMEPPVLRIDGSRPHFGMLDFTLPRQGVALFRLYW